MNVEFARRYVKKYDCFYKDDVNDFSTLVDEMLEKYSDHRDFVFESIGITEKQVRNAKFNEEQFRSALDFYLKEKSKGQMTTY